MDVYISRCTVLCLLFLADCLSVYLSVTLCTVAKQVNRKCPPGNTILQLSTLCTYPHLKRSTPKFPHLKFPRLEVTVICMLGWPLLLQTSLYDQLSHQQLCFLSDFRLLVLRARYGEYLVNVISAPISESHCGSLSLHYCFQCVLLYTCFLHILHMLVWRLHRIARGESRNCRITDMSEYTNASKVLFATCHFCLVSDFCIGWKQLHSQRGMDDCPFLPGRVDKYI